MLVEQVKVNGYGALNQGEEGKSVNFYDILGKEIDMPGPQVVAQISPVTAYLSKILYRTLCKLRHHTHLNVICGKVNPSLCVLLCVDQKTT